jgi:UDP-glucose 4-epimerase
VLEVLNSVAKVIGREVPHVFVGRRSGDAAQVVAYPELAREVLGWSARLDLPSMVSSAWAAWSTGREPASDSGCGADVHGT